MTTSQTAPVRERAGVEPGKARQVYLLLRERIGAGTLGPGSRLPGEATLAAEHGVSRVTLRRALDQLATEGLVARRPGAGTFVRGEGAGPVLRCDLTDVFAHLREMGRQSGVRLLSFTYGPAPAEVAAALGLPADARVQRSVRVRLIDGEPFSLLTTHVPERIGATYSEAELASTPLLELLERSGVVAAQAQQLIGATLAGPDVAEALDVAVGAPLLSLTRAVLGSDGGGMEHLHALYRPDRFSFQMNLVRTGARGRRAWNPRITRNPEPGASAHGHA